MAITPVPLPSASVPVHDPQTGLMTLPWRKFYEYQTYLAEQQAAQTQAAQQQAASAQAQANAASSQAAAAQAGNSGSQNKPQNMSSSTSETLSASAWTPGASVTFTSAFAASSVNVNNSGPTTATGRTSTSTVSGQVRLVRTVGGVDTVVAGPTSFNWVYDGDSGSMDMNFNGFSNLGADSNTGTISYRIDAMGTAGAQLSTTINITRNP